MLFIECPIQYSPQWRCKERCFGQHTWWPEQVTLHDVIVEMDITGTGEDVDSVDDAELSVCADLSLSSETVSVWSQNCKVKYLLPCLSTLNGPL